MEKNATEQLKNEEDAIYIYNEGYNAALDWMKDQDLKEIEDFLGALTPQKIFDIMRKKGIKIDTPSKQFCKGFVDAVKKTHKISAK